MELIILELCDDTISNMIFNEKHSIQYLKCKQEIYLKLEIII